MALSAKFEADFQTFYAAVDQANVKLAGFEAGGSKVSTQLTRMANSLAGTSMIRDASLMVEAVERVGGVSKLTEAELAKCAAQATQAAEKLVAMGEKVPPGMRAIANETKDVTKEHGALRDMVGNVAAGFVAMFTARAAVNFVKDVIEEASAMKDLSAQTHINVEELQLLGGSMKDFGVDTETLGKGLFGLSRRIAVGDDSVARALAVMGLSLKDVDGLNGAELFLKIEDGLATLQGGLRDTTASDLFGSKLGMAMAGASEGIRTTYDEAKKLNDVMGKDAVDAADKFGESIERADRNLHAMALNMIGPVAEGFNVLTDAANKGASKWEIFVAMAKDFAASNTATGASATHLATLLDHLNQKTDANAKATTAAGAAHGAAAPQVDAHAAALQFMATLERNAGAELDAEQLRNLAHLKDIGQLNAENAGHIGVNSAAFAKYKEHLQAAEEATKKMADATAEIASSGEGWRGTLAKINPEIAEQVRGYLSAGVSATSLGVAYKLTATELSSLTRANAEHAKAIEIEKHAVVAVTALWNDYREINVRATGTVLQVEKAQLEAWASELTARLNAAGIETSRFSDALGAVVQAKTRAMMENTAELAAYNSDIYRQSLEDIATKAEASYARAVSSSTGFNEKAIQHFAQVAEAARYAATNWAESFESAAEKATAAVVSSTEQQAAALNRTMPVQALAGGGRVMVGDTTNEERMGIVATNRNALDWRGQPARAMGGPVSGGQAYTVGEQGPELFIPKGGGTIVPNGGGGGGVVLQAGAVVINYPIMNDPRAKMELGQLVGDSIMERLRAAGMRVPSRA